MQLNPYLVFNGQCEEAFTFYEKCLGGSIVAMLNRGDSPMGEQVPPQWRESILHAHLVVGEKVLMGCDNPSEHYERPQGFSVAITVDDPAEADRIFQALAENGKVQMPMAPTFWASRFGMLVDRFGIPWIINGGATA